MKCSTCARTQPDRRLAIYFAAGSDMPRLACEQEACRELARMIIRGDVAASAVVKSSQRAQA